MNSFERRRIRLGGRRRRSFIESRRNWRITIKHPMVFSDTSRHIRNKSFHKRSRHGFSIRISLFVCLQINDLEILRRGKTNPSKALLEESFFFFFPLEIFLQRRRDNRFGRVYTTRFLFHFKSIHVLRKKKEHPRNLFLTCPPYFRSLPNWPH